ncbi:hypothetical protein [Anaeromusa acidaminophila]|uniref:hypothetical protein n=1 Tax=Anaeromusa acidaminophila TaxID=81464 RepID=UPI000373FC38|nr:hypothetical protein [Anaeromusa acidaminophila]
MNNFQWMQKLRSIISVKKKRAGFMLADVIITGTLLAGLAVGFAGLFSSSFVSLGNMRTGLQTQAIAQAKSSQIIAQGYSSMADEPRAAVTGTNFEREVVLGTPVDLGSGAFQRTATINVYKPSESTPRMSLDVPLSSQGSVTSIPSGTICLWSGSNTSIPFGWALCDGTNGTPNLKDRFVIGSGNKYAPQVSGGTEQVTLQASNLPSSALSSLANFWVLSGFFDTAANTSFGNTYQYDKLCRSEATTVNSQSLFFTRSLSYALISSGWSNIPIDIRPPYYALAYIMKL